jgi:2-polyprenyl-3-methyl-5-hydroxy-6-metoxy-1,4-benzoquinol methylase
MLTPGAARRGGMPLYKFCGNRILTWIENRLLRTRLSEFHSGYRAYAVAALEKIPFDLNANAFHFDTDIIIQFVVAALRIVEVPIPTYYGDEICRVNGLAYAWNVVAAALKARLPDLGIFYDRKYDCAQPAAGNAQYQLKIGYDSPHTLTLARVPRSARVLDLGCAEGYMGEVLRRENGCHVTGVDVFPPRPGALDEFVLGDLNSGPPDLDYRNFDCLLLLDVVEHMTSPERFVDDLRRRLALSPHARVLVSTGNVGYLIVRAMLLLGQFNYGKRGILDLTHTRLFTFGSLRRLFEQSGFRLIEQLGVPGPFPLALGPGAFARSLVRLNSLLIRLSKGLFSYQIYCVFEPGPSLEFLLERATEESRRRTTNAIV